MEIRADEFAANLLLPPDELKSFIRRVGPMYSRTRIVQFANKLNVHPGIIVGQLQHHGQLTYAQLRDLLRPIRAQITAAAVTDGWEYMS